MKPRDRCCLDLIQKAVLQATRRTCLRERAWKAEQRVILPVVTVPVGVTALALPPPRGLPLTTRPWTVCSGKTSLEGWCASIRLHATIQICSICRYLDVSCAKNEAKLYMKRFSRGSRGKCILFKDRWVTPNEFQAISGRKSSKDWKRSIRLHGRCLKEFITQGLFQEHPRDCPCAACVGGDSELLRQEGALALAAKKRRLSQADNLSTVDPTFTGSAQLGSIDNESKSSANVLPPAKQRGRPKKNPIPTKVDSPHPTPDVSRIWSPSGGEYCSNMVTHLHVVVVAISYFSMDLNFANPTAI